MKNIIFTADRPTGKLHLGHYVGSLKRRIELQNENNYDEMYIMIADSQALTDNFGNVQKVKNNIFEVALDYLSVGIDPNKVTIFVQSQIPQLTEFTFYYMNLVTLSRLLRNPTVKDEIKLRGFDKSIPAGFLTYPVSQTADITAFNANIVPVGEDQLPMIEQAREIVRSFNSLYGSTLIEPSAILPKNKKCLRLIGIDGKSKMSKSLNNCIYLSDDTKTVHDKIFSMYTDPNHIKVSDPGQIKGNVVFTYLDVFCNGEHFSKYLPEYNNLLQLKNHYKKGGVGDVKVKNFLFNIIEELLNPIRNKRKELEKTPEYIFNILQKGRDKALKIANANLIQLKRAIGIDYKF